MIETYLIYNFILFGTTISAYVYEKSYSKNNQIIFLSLTFLIPFFFLAIRYNIGTDYPNYVMYFKKIASGMETIKEPGYEFINKYIADFGFDVQWVFIFFGFFTFYFAYKAFPKDGFAMSIFLFIAIFYLYEGYSAIRQGLAVAIMLYATKYIYEKNFFKYFLFILLAMSFHLMTAITLLLLYPFVNKKFNKYTLMLIITIMFILIYYFNFSTKLMEFTGMLFPKYAWYLNSKYVLGASVSYGLAGPLIKISIILLIIFNKDSIIKKYPIANIYINFTVIYIISYILHLKMSIFGRVEHIFILYMILSLVFFLKIFKKKTRFIILTLIGLFYYLMFIRYIVNGTFETDNSVHIAPYQTIFNKY